eukprot:CAMPEP_0206224292 /NCGR_PEP_ID=MMETSP0047_2-20121206/6948_1 /ASSEMBLY_ACC=CAM_ASM_000192 /TAXON_ID=195065 /ORGANISM="Chroomonas mesostigmatica_cf, Strain CCMP1168" /LENGTH=172 /DNA_ID=CAMNT_0053647239 /DNA_START=17 /DNA_END=532 /DNA_ORIENTATION=-
MKGPLLAAVIVANCVVRARSLNEAHAAAARLQSRQLPSFLSLCPPAGSPSPSLRKRQPGVKRGSLHNNQRWGRAASSPAHGSATSLRASFLDQFERSLGGAAGIERGPVRRAWTFFVAPVLTLWACVGCAVSLGVDEGSEVGAIGAVLGLTRFAVLLHSIAGVSSGVYGYSK